MKIPSTREIVLQPGDEDRFLTLKQLALRTGENYQTWRIRVVNRNELPYVDVSDKASSKRRPRVRVADYKRWWQAKLNPQPDATV